MVVTEAAWLRLGKSQLEHALLFPFTQITEKTGSGVLQSFSQDCHAFVSEWSCSLVGFLCQMNETGVGVARVFAIQTISAGLRYDTVSGSALISGDSTDVMIVVHHRRCCMSPLRVGAVESDTGPRSASHAISQP